MSAYRIAPFLVGMALLVSSFANPPAPEGLIRGEDQPQILNAPYSQSAKLTAEGGKSGDQFGAWVAMDGSVIVVGAPSADSGGLANSGAAYVYVRQGNGWNDMVQVATLTASDKRAGDGFGYVVAISGDTIVVGAPTANPGGMSNAGAAYYFTKPPTGWSGNLTETGQLFASDNETEDDFGFSVAIDGGVIAVGGLDVDVGSQAWAGVVYLYLNAGSGWSGASEDARLYASDAKSGDWFGYSVDVDGDVIAVGSKYSDPGGLYAAGSAYVFVKPADGWVTMTQNAKLLDSSPAVSDRFGGRIGVSGDVIVVGADGDDPAGSVDAGAAFVFEKPVGGWSGQRYETARLTSSVKESNAWKGFGISVSISGEIIVIGSCLQNIGGVVDAGAAYVFRKPSGGWQTMTETHSITALDKQAGDEFGVAAAISGTEIVVGAWQEDPGNVSNAGSAYVFNAALVSHSQTFISLAVHDGYILEEGEANNSGGTANASQPIFLLGDSALNQQYRAVLSFNTSSLPNRAIVTSVVLKIKHGSLASGNPFVSLKPLVVDIRNPFFGGSAGLAPSDFQAAASRNRIGTFGPSRLGWRASNLLISAFSYVNLGGITQFRLRFSLDDDNDSQADLASFFSGNAEPKYRPRLIIQYVLP